MGRRLLLGIAYFVSSLVTVNAPSIGPGYGFITMAMVLSMLFLAPVEAFVLAMVGGLLSLPFIYYSRSMILEVAVLGVILRPVTVYVAGIAKERHGYMLGSLVLGVTVPLVATSVGILYYGDDGMHSSLSIYDVATILFTLAGYRAWLNSRHAGIIGWLGASLYILGSLYYASLPAATLGAAASLAAPLASKTYWEPRTASLLAALLLVGILAGARTISYNLDIMLYPFKPNSYTQDRWVDPHGCSGRTDLFAGVHDPSRLRIVHECVSVEGVVAGIPSMADDGDYCLDLEVLKSNATPLLTAGNTILRKGRLHAEVTPRDMSVIEGLGGMVCKGDRLIITGVHVVDTDHGQWAEIHPVLSIQLEERGEGPCVLLARPHR